jgi:hypothetical protein
MIDYDGPFSWLDKHRHEMCTCCLTGRAAVHVWDDTRPSWHVADGTVASFMHVHTATYSVDCDGPYERFYTERPAQVFVHESDDDNGYGREDAFAFWRRTVANVTEAFTDFGGTLTVAPVSPESDEREVTWNGPTDEGSVHRNAVLCFRSHCARDRSSQRDHYAESMNY